MISTSSKNFFSKVKNTEILKTYFHYFQQRTLHSVPFAERLIKGSSNFRKSAAATHFTPEMHLPAVKLEEKEKCDQ